MPAGTTILTYLSEGTHAARPAAPSVFNPGGIAIYFETDTNNTFLYDINGTAWVQINGGGVAASPIHNYMSTDPSVVTGSFTDGPSVAQGGTGTWFASGSLVIIDTVNAQNAFNVRLWDGTTIISSATLNITNTAQQGSVHISGYLASPAGNLRISIEAVNHNGATFGHNLSGDSKDCGISAFRIV